MDDILLPLEEYEADPQFQTLTPEQKDSAYSNYYSKAQELAKSEDDFNQILKYRADRGKSALQTNYQLAFPDDTQIDPEKAQSTESLAPLFKSVQQDYAQLDYNQNAKASKFSADDMEDTSREFAYKPFQYGDKKGFSVKYPDGTIESIDDLKDESQLTEFIKLNRLDRFNGKREGFFDKARQAVDSQYLDTADSEFDMIYDKMRKTDAGLKGGFNAIRSRYASMIQGFDVKSIIGDEKYLNRPDTANDTLDNYAKQLQNPSLTEAERKDINQKMGEESRNQALLEGDNYSGREANMARPKELVATGLADKYKDLAKDMIESDKIRGTRVLQQYQDHITNVAKDKQGEFSTFTDYFNRNPGDFAPYLTAIAVSSIPDMGVTIGTAAVVGAATGSPILAGGAAGAVGFQMEYTGTLLSEMQERAASEGRKLYDKGVIESYVDDKGFMAKTEEKAMVRAGIIGVADAVTGGASEAIVQSIKGGLRRAGASLSVNAVSGAGGEAAAQYATEGKFNWTEILNEGIGELSGAPMTVVRGAIQDKFNEIKKPATVQEAKQEYDSSVFAAAYAAKEKSNQQTRLEGMKTRFSVENPSVPTNQSTEIPVDESVPETEVDEIEPTTPPIVSAKVEQQTPPEASSFDRKDEGAKYEMNGIQKGFNDKDEYVPMYQMVTIRDASHHFDGSTIMIPLEDGTVSPKAIEDAIEKKKEQEWSDKARLAEMDELGSVRYDSAVEMSEEDSIADASQLTEKGPGMVFKALDAINYIMGRKPAATPESQTRVAAGQAFQSKLKGTVFSLLSETGSYDRVMKQVVDSNYDESAQGRLMGLLGLSANNSKARVLTNVLGNFWTANGVIKASEPHMYNGLVMSEAIDTVYREEANVDSIYDMDAGKLNEISQKDLFVAMAPDSVVGESAEAYSIQSQPYTAMSNEESVSRFNSQFSAKRIRAPKFDATLNDKYEEASALKRPGIHVTKLTDVNGTPAQQAKHVAWSYPDGFVAKDAKGDNGRNIYHSGHLDETQLTEIIQNAYNEGREDDVYFETSVFPRSGKKSFNEHRVHLYVDAKGKAHAFRNLTFNKAATYYNHDREAISGNKEYDTHILIPDNVNDPKIVALQEFAEKAMSGKGFTDMIFGLDIGESQDNKGKEGNMIFEANALTYGMSGWLGNPIAMSEIISEMTGKPSVLAGMYELAKLGLSKEELSDIKGQVDQGMPPEYAGHPEYYDAINRGVALFNKYLPSAKWLSAMQNMFTLPKKFFVKLYSVITGVFKGSVDRRFEAQQKVRAGKTFDRRSQSTAFDRQFPAHHGTPNNIVGRMTTDKIGTGENTLNEGWGLYVTDTEEIAEWYRRTLSKDDPLYDGSEFNSINPKHLAASLLSDYLQDPNAKHEVTQFLKKKIDNLNAAYKKSIKLRDETDPNLDESRLRLIAINNTVRFYKKEIKLNEDVIDIINSNQEAKITRSNKGNVLKLDIDSDPNHFVNWNREIGEQPEGVQRNLRNALNDIRPENRVEIDSMLDIDTPRVDSTDIKFWTGNRFYKFLVELANEKRLPINGINLGPEPTSQNKFNPERARYNKKHASLFLLKHGIPGIRYFDGDTLAAKKDEKSYNYVIFDDKLITILERKEQERFAQAQLTEKSSSSKALMPSSPSMKMTDYIDQVIAHPDTNKAQSSVLKFIKKNVSVNYTDTITVGKTSLPYSYYSVSKVRIGLNPTQLTPRIALHEIIHAVTSDIIEVAMLKVSLLINPKGKTYGDDSPAEANKMFRYIVDPENEEAMLAEGISKDFIEIVKTYFTFISDLGYGGPDSQLGAGSASYEFQKNNPKIPYGATNLDEFIAEVLSKRSFQTKLSKLPATKGNSRSMYSHVMQLISRMLGIPFNHGGTLLYQAVSESLALITNPSKSVNDHKYLLKEGNADGTWVLRPSSPESDLTNVNGKSYMSDEISNETKANQAVANTDAQKTSVELQAEIDSIEARISQLRNEAPEMSEENQARMKTIEPIPENLPQMREVAIDDLHEKLESEPDDNSKEYTMTPKRVEAIAKLQANKALAINSLGEWINDSRLTDGMVDILLDSIEHVMEKSEDPANLSTRRIKYYVNVLQSMSDGGPPIGFKHIAATMFIENRMARLKHVRDNAKQKGKKRVHIQAPAGDWRREILFGAFQGNLGSTMQQSSEISYMGLSDAGAKFLRDLMGYYKDNIDIQNLEEAAVKAEFYAVVKKAFPIKMSELHAKRIGVVARLTQYEKKKSTPPKDQILSRLNQVVSGLDVETAYNKDDGELSNVAIKQILNNADLATFPDEQVIISFLEGQLTPQEKMVLDKLRELGKRYMPVLQTVKAITKQTTLQEFVNYVHDSNVAPIEESTEQSMLKAFTSMSDILHDRKGINVTEKNTYADLDITAIADKQIRSSTYEKHTGMQRYMLANSLGASSQLTDALDADTDIIKRPVTNRLRTLLASYHNAMTTGQHNFTGALGLVDAATNLVVGSKIIGVNAFVKNSVSSSIARFSLQSLGIQALRDSLTYDTHRAEINAFLKANFPTQYNRTGEYDIIEGSKDRYSVTSKIKRGIDIGHAPFIALIKTFPDAPRIILQSVNDNVMSHLSNLSNGLPEKYSAHAIWTAAYVHYMKQNGTVKDMQDFILRKPIDRRAANDANDFVSNALGYAPDKAAKGTYWNASTASKKIISKAWSVFRQQSTGLALDFQNNMQKSIRLFASGNFVESKAALQLATVALMNSMSFRALTIALSGSMMWGGLDRFFNASSDEEKKKKLIEAKRKYTENANRNNMRDFISESLLMLIPVASSAMFVENAVAGLLDKNNVVVGFTPSGFELERKADIKKEIEVVKAEIDKLEKAARLKVDRNLSTEAEDDAIEKLEITKSQLTEKSRFKYFPSQSDKAMMSVFGSYGMAEEYIAKTIDTILDDDLELGTEQKKRMKVSLENEFSYRDPLAGSGFILTQVNDMMGYARKLIPSQHLHTQPGGKVPNALFWMEYFKVAQNPRVVIERARIELAKEAVMKAMAGEKKALRIEQRWADKYRK